ncbi:MAG: amidohydrolase family protein, partial [Candidatus Bathyarchaeia archaeon]
PLKLPTQISAGAVAGILASLLGAHDDDVESGMQAFLSTVKAVNEEEAKRLENEWERLKLEYETKLKAESLEADLARQEYELAEKIAIPALSMQTEAAQRMYDEIWKAETPEAFDVALARARQSNVFGILGIPEPEPSVVESYRKAIQSKNLVKLADDMASMLQQARIAAERGAPETVALVFRHFAEAAGLPTEELARVRNEFQDIYDSAVVNNLLAQIGGITKYLWKLPELLKRDIEQGVVGWDNLIAGSGWENIYVSSVTTDRNKHLEGKNLVEIARMRGKDEFTALFDLLLEEEGKATMVIFQMSDEDVHRVMKSDLQMVGTDSWAVAPYGILSCGKPHPRFYGTYPRILGKYVREEGVLTLEEAIRKMSSFPAQKIKLKDRGLMKEGMWADIVIFDPAKVKDRATYEDPHKYPEGIEYVLVNGKLVIEGGEHTGALNGKVLRHIR